MLIENKIFDRCNANFEKLKNCGFQKQNNGFRIEKIFEDGLFKAIVEIDFDGKISGMVYDLESREEFLPLRIKNNQGVFVNKIRAEYEKFLEDIRDNYFTKKYFIYPQSNRIADLIIKKYGDFPEFLWEKTPGSGVFRNGKTKKWYFVILDIDKSKIQKDKKGLIEIALLKLDPDEISQLTAQKHYYHAYHMNKKHWITIILDETITDSKIMELIEKSYNFTVKKGRKPPL